MVNFFSYPLAVKREKKIPQFLLSHKRQDKWKWAYRYIHLSIYRQIDTSFFPVWQQLAIHPAQVFICLARKDVVKKPGKQQDEMFPRDKVLWKSRFRKLCYSECCWFARTEALTLWARRINWRCSFNLLHFMTHKRVCVSSLTVKHEVKNYLFFPPKTLWH